MKIILVGATGTIGQCVSKELSERHTVIPVSNKQGNICVDIADTDSIVKMYESIGQFDALVSTTGKVHFGELTSMSDKEYAIGLQNKLMGQINLVLIGLKYINPQGSFTLTSGILGREVIRYGSSAAMINGAIDNFVRSAAIEMPNQIRINSVSPTVLTESMKDYAEYFRGFESVSGARVALAYSKSVEGAQTGQVFTVG